MTEKTSTASAPASMTATQLVSAFASKELSPVEVFWSEAERVHRLEPQLHAFLSTTLDTALEQARAAERAYQNGTAGALAGVPSTIKDLTPTRGVRTTLGSLTRENWIPDFDTPVVERMRDAGAVFLGKTNTPEMGWKAASGNRLGPRTTNPWNTALTPGGSSSGAAAALAAGIGALAQGSDGAGSVRIPASYCGIVGFKPTYGLIPHFPVSMIGNLSHLGPMARSVADCALMMDVVQGADPRDPHSWSSSANFSADLGQLGKPRVGWVSDLGYAKAEPAIQASFDAALRLMEGLGWELVEIPWTLPDPYDLVEMVWTSGMASHHRFSMEQDEPLLDFGRAELVRHGLTLTGPELSTANRRFAEYHDAVRALTAGVDLLVTPTLPCGPFDNALDFPPTVNGVARPEPLGWTSYTYPFNVTGQPAISVPCGFDDQGMPVGLQIVGPWRRDELVLQAAHDFELARGPLPASPLLVNDL